ncbi:hypothetical protein G9A89_020576 [Geosiphon pyriformis]|nr:hypothetical protein G9A89_020576 [Geosiphon pyriformis]
MKKSAKDFSADTVSKDVASRKKKKGGVLKDSAAQKMVLSNKVVGGSWGSEAGNTIESDSMDMKEEFLVEKTITKQALGKLLDKINFLGSDDNDILLDGPVVFLPFLKNLVNVSVRKSFALDISLDNVVKKSTQEKLVIVYLNWKRCYTNAHDIWDFIGFVDGKTCTINCHSVTYAQTKCAIVCFESTDSLNAVMETTLVLRGAHFYWSHFGSAVCAMCGKLDHTSLVCASDRNFSSGKLPYQALSDADKSRLAAIYAKCLAPVAQPVAFGGAL